VQVVLFIQDILK